MDVARRVELRRTIQARLSRGEGSLRHRHESKCILTAVIVTDLHSNMIHISRAYILVGACVHGVHGDADDLIRTR